MINAIAIDDEPQALEVIRHYAGKIDYLDLDNVYTNPYEALDVIKSQIPDLLFLDIKMPDLTGMEFLALLPKPVPTILITAYEEFALESYDFLCIDYLVKPVTFSRFVAAIEKFRTIQRPIKGLADASMDKIQFYTGSETIFISPSEILYIEADGNYCKLNCTDKRLLVPESLAALEKRLPGMFSRVHRSFIVNLQAIDRVDSYRIHIDSYQLPIGRKFKADFRKLIDK